MKVSFRQSWLHGGIDVFFYEKHHDGKIFVVKPVVLELEELSPAGCVENPTFQIGYLGAKEFMKDIAIEIENFGIKTESAETMKGTMEAQKYHLEDLRKLLKIEGGEQK